MAKKKKFMVDPALTQGLDEVLELGDSCLGEYRFEPLSLEKIELDPNNPRKMGLSKEEVRHEIPLEDPFFDKKQEELQQLKNLASSINEKGVLNPIIVYKQGSNYRILAGERRYLASILAEKTMIPAKILDSRPDEHDLKLMQWIENIHRKDLSAWERLINFKTIVETYSNKFDKTASVEELEKLTGLAKTQVYLYQSLLNIPDDVELALETNKIDNLRKAALISKSDKLSNREILIQECVNGASIKELTALFNSLENKLSETKKPEQVRGRKSKKVNFGSTTSTITAKKLFEYVLSSSKLPGLDTVYATIDWEDVNSVNSAWKKLIKTIEEFA